jgi:LysR family nod box-dependent transcriptional activator
MIYPDFSYQHNKYIGGGRMRINRLDLNQLACLDALLAHRNVSRAAQQVHLSQPAVSAVLSRLRDYFGDPLLVQSGRQYSLSPFAASLVEPVRDLLLQAQALTRRRPENDPARIEREVIVVGSDYVFSAVLGPLFRRAEKEAPGLRFELRPVAVYLAQEIDISDVDLVLSAASTVSPDHPSELLFSDTFSCLAWSGNPLIGPSLTQEAFLRLGHVVTLLGQGRVPTLDQIAFEGLRIQRRVEVRVPSFTLVPACVVDTSRIATLQTFLAHRLARSAALRVMPCPFNIPPLVMAAQWHRHQNEDPAIQWVRRTLREVVLAEGLAPCHPTARVRPASRAGTPRRPR